MIVYNSKILPKEFIPDWQRWTREPKAIPSELASLTIGIDPSVFFGKDKLKPSTIDALLEKNQESNGTPSISRTEIRESLDKILGLIKSHLEDKQIQGLHRRKNNIDEINIWEYITWLDHLDIPYPNELKKCYKPPALKNKPEDELNNNRLVIAALLKWINDKDLLVGQGTLSDLFSEKNTDYGFIKLTKRNIDGIFSASKKLMKE
jgi:hypothetical protein